MSAKRWIIVFCVVCALTTGAFLAVFTFRGQLSQQGQTLRDIKQQQDGLLGEMLEQTDVLAALQETHTALSEQVTDILPSVQETIDAEVLGDVFGGGGALSAENPLPVTASSIHTILDLGWGVHVSPSTNARGKTAFTTCGCESGKGDEFPPCVWELKEGSSPALLADFSSLNDDLIGGMADPPFVTFEDTILVPCFQWTGPDEGDDPYWSENHLYLYRIEEGEAPSLVYQNESAKGAYYGTQDPLRGSIYISYFTRTNSVVIKSTDDGKTWAKVYDVEQSPDSPVIYSADAYNDVVIASLPAKKKVLRSPDGGQTWEEWLDVSSEANWVGNATIIGERAFVPCDSGFYISRHLDFQVDWWYVHIPYDRAATFKEVRPVGGYLVTSARDRNNTLWLASADSFYTVSPIMLPSVFGSYNVNPGLARPYSAFGNTLFVGSHADGGGILMRVELPQFFPVRVPCPRDILDLPSLGAGATSELSNCLELEPSRGASTVLTVECTYHADASAGAKLYLYSGYDLGSWDTEPVETRTLVFGAGQTKRETFTLSSTAQAARFLKCRVENLSETQAATGLRITATVGA